MEWLLNPPVRSELKALHTVDPVGSKNHRSPAKRSERTALRTAGLSWAAKFADLPVVRSKPQAFRTSVHSEAPIVNTSGSELQALRTDPRG